MRRLCLAFVRDESGIIVSAELIVIATVAVLALVVGWSAVSAALVGELGDVAGAISGLDQSYGIRQIRDNNHSFAAGSGFNDFGNNIQFNSNNQQISGGIQSRGGGSIGGAIAGGGSFSGGFSGGGGGRARSEAPAPRSAAPRSAPAPEEVTDVIIEERVLSEDLLDSVEVDSRILRSVPLADAPRAAPESRPRAATDECENLKSKIRELCKELQQLDQAGSALQPLQPLQESAR